jgi:hypothetical protein
VTSALCRAEATIRETRPGVFDVAGTGKQRSLFTFAETEPCVVQLTIKVTPPQPGHVIADLRQLTGITLEENGTQDGLAGWRVKISGAEGAFSMVSPDHTEALDELTTTIYTSATRAQMEAAANEVRTRCAGMPVVEQAVSPVDLLAMSFAGVADGATVNIGSAGGRATKEFDGLYTIEPISDGQAVRMAITQTGRCTFAFDLSEGGEPQVIIKLDASLITGVTITDDGARGELHGYKITIAGDPNAVILQQPDGTQAPGDQTNYTTTSLALADLQSAADRFRAEYCPGTP